MKPRQPFRPNLQPIVGKNGKVVPIKLVKDPSIGSGLSASKDTKEDSAQKKSVIKLKKEPAKRQAPANTVTAPKQSKSDQDMASLSQTLQGMTQEEKLEAAKRNSMTKSETLKKM